MTAFYRFFHAHVTEQVQLTRFVSDEATLAIEAIVRLDCRQTLSQAVLDANGFGRLAALDAGQRIELPQFIHYHLHDGRFTRVVCALVDPPAG